MQRLQKKSLEKFFTLSLLCLFTSLTINISNAAVSNQTTTQPAPTAPASTAPASPTQSPSTSPVQEKSKPEIFRENLASVGITFTQTNGNVDVVIDEKKAIDALPNLISLGVIPKIDAKDIKNAPLSISVGVIGLSFSIVILDYIYTENKSLDKVHMQSFVIPIGSNAKQLCFSFDYDGKLYKKLDLNTLTPKDFINNTPNFSFTDWCKTNMSKEVGP